jgi:hypothetical protein
LQSGSEVIAIQLFKQFQNLHGPTRQSSVFGQDAKPLSNLIVVGVFSRKGAKTQSQNKHSDHLCALCDSA